LEEKKKLDNDHGGKGASLTKTDRRGGTEGAFCGSWYKEKGHRSWAGGKNAREGGEGFVPE